MDHRSGRGDNSGQLCRVRLACARTGMAYESVKTVFLQTQIMKEPKFLYYKQRGIALLLIAAMAVFGAANFAYAGTMTSGNYVILNDTQNCGGGKSSSANYIVYDSMCENAAGEKSSSSSIVDAGFQGAKDRSFIDISLSGNTIGFGTLSVDSVSTTNITLNVSTNANNGYNADIITDGDFRSSSGDALENASASDTISAGSGKYGIRTSGSDGQYNAVDTGIGTTAKTFASNNSGVGASATIITFKAAPSAITGSGQYSQAITILVAGTF